MGSISIQQISPPKCLEHLFPWPPPCLRRCRSLAHRVAAEVFSVDAAARTCLRMDTLDAWETCPYVTILCHWTADGNKGNLKIIFEYWNIGWDLSKLSWQASRLIQQWLRQHETSNKCQFADSSFQQQLFKVLSKNTCDFSQMSFWHRSRLNQALRHF